MFIQVIQGRAGDADAIRRQEQVWIDDLSSGAEGWLGDTSGMSWAGEYIAVVRFESEAAARRNNDRPEQGKWWEETVGFFDGEVEFHDCPEVQLYREGGSDEAGFVQVIQGRATDVERVKQLFVEMDDARGELRPDVLGATVAWDGPFLTQTVYFSSEADARKGEETMGNLPPQDRAGLDEVRSLVRDTRFIDLQEPVFHSP